MPDTSVKPNTLVEGWMMPVPVAIKHNEPQDVALIVPKVIEPAVTPVDEYEPDGTVVEQVVVPVGAR